MKLTKRLKIVFVISAVLMAACSNKESPSQEPSPAELSEELKYKPLSSDGPVKSLNSASAIQDTINAKDKTPDCLHDIVDTNLSDYGYDTVILVDKAERPQHLYVLRYGADIFKWKTSTGDNIKMLNKRGEMSDRHTPVGFFTPIPGRLYESYHSEDWDAPMPYSIFFNGGVAIHATIPKYYNQLGRPASGGCLRLELQNAKILFDLVKNETGRGRIAKVTPNGCFVKNKKGEVEFTQGYKTLIVIYNSDLN